MAGKAKKGQRRQDYLDKVLGDSIHNPVNSSGFSTEDGQPLTSPRAYAATEYLGDNRIQHRILQRVELGEFPDEAAMAEGVQRDQFLGVWMASPDNQFTRFRRDLLIAEGRLRARLLGTMQSPNAETVEKQMAMRLMERRFPSWNGRLQTDDEKERLRVEVERLKADIRLKDAQQTALSSGTTDVTSFNVIIRKRDPADDLTREKIDRHTAQLQGKDDDTDD